MRRKEEFRSCGMAAPSIFVLVLFYRTWIILFAKLFGIRCINWDEEEELLIITIKSLRETLLIRP